MREGWESARLRDVCSLDKAKHDGSALPYVGMEHIEGGGAGRFVEEPAPTEVKSATFRFTPDHLLYGRLRPYLNKLIAPDFEGHCSTEIFPILCSSGIDRRYLFYWLSAEPTVAEINRTCTGARMPRANMNEVLDFEIPLPPLTEQKRIVAILDEAFEAIERAEANTVAAIDNASAIYETSLEACLSDCSDVRQVLLADLLSSGDIVDHMDGNHGSDYPRKHEFIDSGVPYLSANCIQHDAVRMDLAKHLSHDRSRALRKGFAKSGDVLFAHNATVGPVALLTTTEDTVVLGTSLTYYRCAAGRISPEYLAHFMRSRIFTMQYRAVMRQSTRNQVPITKQRTFEFLVPPFDEQVRIAEQLDGIRNVALSFRFNRQAKIQWLAQLRSALLQSAFSGELGVSALDTEAVIA